MAETITLGTNVKATIKGSSLTLTVDLSQTNGQSKSGKTRTIGTTRGNARIVDNDGNEFVIGLNVYRYPTEEEKENDA